MEKPVRLNIKCDPKLHIRVSVRAAERGQTLQQYVVEALQEAVKRPKAAA